MERKKAKVGPKTHLSGNTVKRDLCVYCDYAAFTRSLPFVLWNWPSTSRATISVNLVNGITTEVDPGTKSIAVSERSNLAKILEDFYHVFITPWRFDCKTAAQEKQLNRLQCKHSSGAPGVIRTRDLLLRSSSFNRWRTQNQEVARVVVGNRWRYWAGLVDFFATICATKEPLREN